MCQNKKMNLLLVFLLLTPLIQTSGAIFTFSTIIDMFRLVYFSTRGIWGIIDRAGMESTPAEFQTKLIKGVNELSDKIDGLSDRLDLYGKETLNRLYDIEAQISYEIQLNNFIDSMIEIDKNFKLLKMYTANNTRNDTVEKYTLMNFAKTAVSHSDNSVYSHFLKISVFAIGSESEKLIARKSLFDLVHKKVSKTSNICNLSQSPSEYLTNLFFVLQLTQIKAYLILNFSWAYLRFNNKGQFIKEENILKNNFLKQIFDQTEILKISLDDANNSFWKCDPLIYKNDITYTEITKFLQGFVINEVDISPGENCWSNCDYYSFTKQYGCYWDLPCGYQPKCKGNIVGCRYHSDSQLCLSENNSTRIYDYIQFDNNDVFGKVTPLCKNSTSSSSWRRWLFWFCSSCYCYCDDDTNSDRYFSLRPVISDTGNNKIITGLRFIKINRVIYLQIQEGELIANAGINADTVHWVPVNSFDITDENVKLDDDYHKLTWEYRAIDLDDLIVPENYLVTGIKFRRLGGHLNLEIHATMFNYTTGKLIKPYDNSFWISSDSTDGNLRKPRTELYLSRPDNPTINSDGQLMPSNIYSRNDQFINFQHSDDIFDAGQTAVPFIDIQKVSPQPAVPLVGIGIYHKGRKYSGGFIAPKVFTYKNYNNLLNFQKDLASLNVTLNTTTIQFH